MCLTAYALPNEWDSMKNESNKTVKVDKNSEEYKTVLEKFTKKGVTISEIVQVSIVWIKLIIRYIDKLKCKCNFFNTYLSSLFFFKL